MIPTEKTGWTPLPHSDEDLERVRNVPDTPQTVAPTMATTALSGMITSSSPAAATRALPRMTLTRPKRAIRREPASRVPVIAARNNPSVTAPRVLDAPWPSTMVRLNQSLAAPSASAIPSTTRPISSVVRSRHALPPGDEAGPGEPFGPAGVTAVDVVAA